MRHLLTLLALLALVAACGGPGESGGTPGGDEPGNEAGNGDGNGDNSNGNGEDEISEEDLQDARDLLGTPEDEIEEDPQTRIMRRGDENLAGTMDLRPGRRNLELDQVDGTYVVTRIVIETFEDPIVIE